MNKWIVLTSNDVNYTGIVLRNDELSDTLVSVWPSDASLDEIADYLEKLVVRMRKKP